MTHTTSTSTTTTTATTNNNLSDNFQRFLISINPALPACPEGHVIIISSIIIINSA